MIPLIGVEGAKIIGTQGDDAALLESFRILRNNISFSCVDRELKMLAVTSSNRGEGKSTTIANLAIAMAMDGKRVLLVDLDLRRPTQHTIFGLSRSQGFSSVITGQCSIDEAIHTTRVENLSILPSGPTPPNPPELLNSKRAKEVLRDLSAQYDLLLLDCTPCVGLSDAQVVASQADAVVLVASMNETPKPMFQVAARVLAQVRAPLVGTVLNKMQVRRQSYYDYYYCSHYAYCEYGDESAETPRKKRWSFGKGSGRKAA